MTGKKLAVKLPFSILLFSLILASGPVTRAGQTDIPQEVVNFQPCLLKVVAYDDEGNKAAEGFGFLVEEGLLVTAWDVAVCAYRLEVETSEGSTLPAEGYVYESFKTYSFLVSVALPPGSVPVVKLKREIPQKNSRVFLVGRPGGASSGIVPVTFNYADRQYGLALRVDHPQEASRGALILTADGKAIGMYRGDTGLCGVPSGTLLSLRKNKLKTFQENWALNRAHIPSRLKRRAEEHLQAGRIDEAFKLLNKAAQLSRSEYEKSTILWLLAKSSFDLGRYDDAATALQAVIDLAEQKASDPDWAVNQATMKSAYARLAVSRARLGHHDQAAAVCQKGLDRYGPDVMLLGTLGGIRLEQNRHEEALAAYQNALRIKQDDYPALFGMGLAYEFQGKTALAMAAYEKAVAVATAGEAEAAQRLAALKKKKR